MQVEVGLYFDDLEEIADSPDDESRLRHDEIKRNGKEIVNF